MAKLSLLFISKKPVHYLLLGHHAQQNMDTLHMLTEPIRKAKERRLQVETNGLIKEFIYAILL